MQKNQQTNNELYIEVADFVAAGYRGETVSQNIYNNGQYWMSIKNPKDLRMPMVHFDSLRPKDKARLNKHYGGDVYAYYARLPIEKLFVPDARAEEYYRNYRYGNELQLPYEVQVRYARAASVLNGCLKAVDNRRFVKDELGIKHVESFWAHVLDIIKVQGIALPNNYGGLVSKPDSAIKQYRPNNYASLIHGNYGNKSAAKIGKAEGGYCPEVEEKQIALFRKVARLHMNLDNVQITKVINELFAKNGWEQISPATVANLVARHMPNIITGKKGSKVYNNTVAMQVQRVASDIPTHFWTLDGWTAELLYQDEHGKLNRLTIVVVLDMANKYPVGYAIGDRENTELIRMALRNAIIHMQELYGATYRPWQLQSDKYQIKNLTPFYEAVGHLHFSPSVGNAKAKPIERYFLDMNKECQLQYNWSGYGLSSTNKNQPNTEWIDKHKKLMPDKAGVIEQLNKMMQRRRADKIDQFRQLWQAMPLEEQVTLSPEDCLLVFGKAHTELNSITGLGLIATVNGKKEVFDSFDPAFRALQFATRFQVIYDPEDISHVLAVTEDGKRRFMLHNKVKVGMGYKNTTPEQLDYRQRIADFNKARKEELIQTYLQDDALVQEVLDNTPFALNDAAEAALKLMLTDGNGQQKEALQDARGLKQIQDKAARQDKAADKAVADNWAMQQEQLMRSKIDFNKYFD